MTSVTPGLLIPVAYDSNCKLVEIARPFLGRFKVFPPTSTILEYFYTLLHGDLLHTPA